MSKEKVVVVIGDEVVRVSLSAFIDVLGAAGQMKEDWMEYEVSCGKSKGRAKAGLDALNTLSRTAHQEQMK